MMQNTQFDQAVRLLCESSANHALPYSERLYQVAGAAVGFGLQFADAEPEELDRWLYDAEQTSSPADIADLTALVRSFTSAPIQKSLRFAARTTGTPLLAMATGLVIHHFQQTHGRDGADDPLPHLHTAAGYCLRFTLMLARLHPRLAREYRALIPR